MKKMNNKGFTLMEMLIVVAIIAVLVAIAIPTFNNALEKSREAADAANIRAAYAQVIANGLDAEGNKDTDDAFKDNVLSVIVECTQRVPGWESVNKIAQWGTKAKTDADATKTDVDTDTSATGKANEEIGASRDVNWVVSYSVEKGVVSISNLDD